MAQARANKEIPINDIETVESTGINITIQLPRLDQRNGFKIHTLKVFEDKFELCETLYQKGKTNRIIDRYRRENLFLLEFNNRVKVKSVQRIMLKPIFINSLEYNFLGCSSSGLKARKCYLWQGKQNDVQNMLNENGEFANIATVSKRLARISLLFTEIQLTFVIEESQIIREDDIETEDGVYNFTDGCGQIGHFLAKALSKSINVNEEIIKVIGKDSQYIPSVYQIRYKGCKGIVCLNSHLEKNSIMIRKSMEKFKCPTSDFKHKIGVAEFSKPYSYGKINKQYTMLLSGLGVPKKIFIKKHMEHFARLKVIEYNKEEAIMLLLWKNRSQLVYDILNSPNFTVDVKIISELKKFRTEIFNTVEKIKILIPESRNIFGVCDPIGVLDYGECFVRPTIRGVPTSISGLVVVGKNPCYLLGDIRVLKAVDSAQKPEVAYFENDLIDCIVFPTKGSRPHSNEIAGSDLDGDKYFVCWDPDLIPPNVARPYTYPDAPAKPTGQISREKMIAYFSNMNRTQATVGKVDTLFNQWANRNGIDSFQCVRLGQLFSRAIDSAKSGEVIKIDPGLELPRDDDENLPIKYVWQELIKLSQEAKLECTNEIFNNDDTDVTYDFILNMVKNRDVSVDEFRLFNYIHKWKEANPCTPKAELNQLYEYIDFGKFSRDQRFFACERGIDWETVVNALNKSKILTPELRRHYMLKASQTNWKFYFRGNQEYFLWSYLRKALTTFEQTLLVIHLSSPPEMIFVLHFMGEFQTGEKLLFNANSSITAYFFSTQYKYFERFDLGKHSEITIEDEMLQIFHNRSKDLNTFLWFKADVPYDKEKKRNNVEMNFDTDISHNTEKLTYSSDRNRPTHFKPIEEEAPSTHTNNVKDRPKSKGVHEYSENAFPTISNDVAGQQRDPSNIPQAIPPSISSHIDIIEKKASAELLCDRLSVDLTSFNRQIFIGTRNHPRVRRSAPSCIEIFVQDSEKDPLYFDSYLLDEVESPTELEEPDSSDDDDEDSDDNERGKVQVLEAKLPEAFDFTSDESILEHLAIFARDSKLLDFKAVIDCSLRESKMPEGIIFEFVKLLTNIKLSRGHKPLTEPLFNILNAVLNVLKDFITDVKDFITLLCKLCQLDLEKTATSTLKFVIESNKIIFSNNDCINLMLDWTIWVELTRSLARKVVDWLLEFTLEARIDDGSSITNHSSVSELIADMHLNDCENSEPQIRNDTQNSLKSENSYASQINEESKIDSVAMETEILDIPKETIPEPVAMETQDPYLPKSKPFHENLAGSNKGLVSNTSELKIGKSKKKRTKNTSQSNEQISTNKNDISIDPKSNRKRVKSSELISTRLIDLEELNTKSEANDFKIAQIASSSIEDNYLKPTSDQVCWSYVVNYSRLEILALLYEMKSVRENIAKIPTKKEGVIDSVSSLKVDSHVKTVKGAKGTVLEDREVSQVNFYSLCGGVGNASARGRITAGQWVAISRKRHNEAKPCWSSTLCMGLVSHATDTLSSITVDVYGDLPKVLQQCTENNHSWRWRLDLLANITSFTRSIKALNMIYSEREGAIEILPILTHSEGLTHLQNFNDDVEPLGPVEVTDSNRTSNPNISQSLNESQRLAVEASLTQRITLIQGPPGTGKTYIACECILLAVKRGCKVLVSAETHNAVDNILIKLLKTTKLKVIRLGNLNHVKKELWEYTLDLQLEEKCEKKGKSAQRRDDEGRIHRDNKSCKEILKEAEIVFTTCAGAGEPFLTNSNVIFDFVLIDEATQAMEPISLCPMVMGCKQLVLIGDPMQLSPLAIIHDDDDDDEVKEHLPSTKVLSTTLFHRLYPVVNYFFLNQQHRMHPALAIYPSEHFYGGKLHSNVEKEDRVPPSFPWPIADNPQCCINLADSQEHRKGSSIENEEEAKYVNDIIEFLLAAPLLKDGIELKASDITVITPYVAQKKCISANLTKSNQIDVHTIDGYQGKENEIIIISMTRTNPDAKLGFVDNPNRINVLLTRAKRGLIVVANVAALKDTTEYWSAWLKQPNLIKNSFDLDLHKPNRGSDSGYLGQRGLDSRPRQRNWERNNARFNGRDRNPQKFYNNSYEQMQAQNNSRDARFRGNDRNSQYTPRVNNHASFSNSSSYERSPSSPPATTNNFTSNRISRNNTDSYDVNNHPSFSNPSSHERSPSSSRVRTNNFSSNRISRNNTNSHDVNNHPSFSNPSSHEQSPSSSPATTNNFTSNRISRNNTNSHDVNNHPSFSNPSSHEQSPTSSPATTNNFTSNRINRNNTDSHDVNNHPSFSNPSSHERSPSSSPARTNNFTSNQISRNNTDSHDVNNHPSFSNPSSHERSPSSSPARTNNFSSNRISRNNTNSHDVNNHASVSNSSSHERSPSSSRATMNNFSSNRISRNNTNSHDVNNHASFSNPSSHERSPSSSRATMNNFSSNQISRNNTDSHDVNNHASVSNSSSHERSPSSSRATMNNFSSNRISRNNTNSHDVNNHASVSNSSSYERSPSSSRATMNNFSSSQISRNNTDSHDVNNQSLIDHDSEERSSDSILRAPLGKRFNRGRGGRRPKT